MSKIEIVAHIQIEVDTRDRLLRLLSSHPRYRDTEMGFSGFIDRFIEKEWDNLETTVQEKALLPLSNLIHSTTSADEKTSIHVAKRFIEALTNTPEDFFKENSEKNLTLEGD